jgi:RNA polymerase sigma-70 factor (ECF subfamily)
MAVGVAGTNRAGANTELQFATSGKGPVVAFTDIDRRVLKQCLSKAPGAWEDFVDRFIGLFVHVIQHTAHARSVTLSRDDLDDLCSEIVLLLLQNDFAVLRHFRGSSSLATYLTVVARRVAVRELIKRKQSEAMGHVNAHNSAIAAGGGAGEVQRIDDEEEVRILLKLLSPSDAAIVRKYHLDGRSYRQISEELGIAENSIGPTLTRARDRLREMQVRS